MMDAETFKKNVTLAMLRQAIEEAAAGLNIPADTLKTLIEQAWERLGEIESPLR